MYNAAELRADIAYDVAAAATSAGAKWWGCAVGMAAGCLLGLTPLLFFENKEKDQQQGERAAAGSS